MSTRTDGRNAEIARRLDAGATVWDLGREFGLSTSAIQPLARRARLARAASERTAALRQAMREVDDLDRPWPLQDLVDALELPSRAATAMRRHFETRGMSAPTLRELMDAVVAEHVPEIENPLSRLLVYTWPGVGQYLGDDILAVLWEVDFGQAFHGAWIDRLRRLYRDVFADDYDCLRLWGASVRELLLST